MHGFAGLREQELTAQLNALKAGSGREGEEAVELRSLEREAAAQRDLLETYLSRYREAASRSEPKALPADARVISRAVPASESFYPKTVPIIVVSALATFLLASIGVMLGELFSGRALRPSSGMVREPSAEHSETAAATPTIAPEVAAAMPAIANDADDFSVEAVAEQLLSDGTPVAVCVSPEGDEGSAAAVMLARTVAGEGYQTLLIDLTGSACPTELMAESKRSAGSHRPDVRRDLHRGFDPSRSLVVGAYHSARQRQRTPRHARHRPTANDHQRADRGL